jgi:hypothetical protein
VLPIVIGSELLTEPVSPGLRAEDPSTSMLRPWESRRHATRCHSLSAMETLERTVSTSVPDRMTQLGLPSSPSTCSFHCPPLEPNLPFCTMLDPTLVSSPVSHTLAP